MKTTKNKENTRKNEFDKYYHQKKIDRDLLSQIRFLQKNLEENEKTLNFEKNEEFPEAAIDFVRH